MEDLTQGHFIVERYPRFETDEWRREKIPANIGIPLFCLRRRQVMNSVMYSKYFVVGGSLGQGALDQRHPGRQLLNKNHSM